MNKQFKLLFRIHQLGNEFFYIYKYKVIRYVNNNVAGVDKFTSNDSARLWNTGKVVWTNPRILMK